MLALSIAIATPARAQQHAGHQHRKPAASLAISAGFAPTGDLWIVGLDAQRKLFIQTSADAGLSWSPQRHIATGDDTPAAEGEARPKLAFGPDGCVVITYTQPLSKPYTGLIRMLRSTDGGRTFSAPFTVHRDRQVITHRFDAVAFDARGTLHTLWVDKRDLTALRARGKSDYRGAAIYRNESSDGGKTFGRDLKLADHSCECCRIALAPSPDGGLVALWRHVFAPNERDHAFAPVGSASSRGPARATYDHWAIDACPHHGPGLAAAQGGGYHAVWFGERDGVAGVRYGRLFPDGTPRGEPVRLPDEAAEHADVQSIGRKVVIAWRSFDGQATRWRVWVSHDDGRSFTLRDLGRTTEDNDHPRLARRGQDIFALWRTTEGVRVERVAP
ncbi:glycoside hydrolase [Aquabacterium sp. A7-Y]|uniref:sialidase family protein n=1 Tax=Aquabacterium sp. A7-Y TaxID=1349605 RepID=UPI00223DDB1D|nr:sialidase family protein [Aquabacterium sp. A7-Y]MCW7537992.1 glycoside hydrolase [Aquabacterium sp. A7-Y]